jgi:hypothetical protein
MGGGRGSHLNCTNNTRAPRRTRAHTLERTNRHAQTTHAHTRRTRAHTLERTNRHRGTRHTQAHRRHSAQVVFMESGLERPNRGQSAVQHQISLRLRVRTGPWGTGGRSGLSHQYEVWLGSGEFEPLGPEETVPKKGPGQAEYSDHHERASQ